jgi:hypothetical protein
MAGAADHEWTVALEVSRILHAGYIFSSGETQLAFDPIFENPFSSNCYAFPNVRFDCKQIRKLDFAAVFISHFHDDHFSLESLDLLHRDTPIYFFCKFEELFSLLRELGFTKIFSLKLDSPILIGPFVITPRRALDEDVDSIFQIQVSNLNILNVVDSWIDPVTLAQLEKNGPWDLILWPFQTMREIEVLSPSRAQPAPGGLPPEGIEQLQRLRPKNLVASSCQFQLEEWSWYNRAFFPISYQLFEEVIANVLPDCQVRRLDPGASLRVTPESMHGAEPLKWIVPLGEKNVDYVYDPHLVAPPTAEVAKNFAPLNKEQADFVFDFCAKGICERFSSLELLEEEYFCSPRTWRLCIFDHEGNAETFFYTISGRTLTLLGESDSRNLGWATEVPLNKLYAALANGESLTSMYMRINDIVFDPDTEIQVSSVDILCDPLIRCLFEGSVANYQRAQLQRISRIDLIGGPS